MHGPATHAYRQESLIIHIYAQLSSTLIITYRHFVSAHIGVVQLRDRLLACFFVIESNERKSPEVLIVALKHMQLQ